MKHGQVVFLAAIPVIIISQLLIVGLGHSHEKKENYQSTIVPNLGSNAAATIQKEGSTELPIEKNSTIASDIIKIWHDMSSKAICVALNQDARCPNPALRGRLSGPSLAILEWKKRKPPTSATEGTETVLCGSYGHNWLDAGEYFVEIIIMYCNDFGVNAPQRTNNITAWMEADPGLHCVEDVRNNRITSKDATQSIIHIPTSIEGRDSYRLGRWARRHQFPSQPLYTRYQPVKCAPIRVKGHWQFPPLGSPLYEYCSPFDRRDKDGTNEGENITGLYEYEFQWNMKVSEEELVEKFRQRQRDKSIPRICAVGDSHSRKMVRKTLPRLNLTGLYVDWITSFFPDPNRIQKKIKDYNCDVFFVQVSQWPSGFHSGGHPFSIAKYHEKLKLHVQNILEFNPNARIYLPTGDQCPLNARVIQCEDWRAPTLVDAYSYVHQMIEQELNTSQVKYLDTNFIISTHWDGHSDWQHLMEIVRARKTIYMSAIMLGETEWFERQ